MNLQTPYGDPLIPTLMDACLHTLGCCLTAIIVALFIGGVVAIVWHGTEGWFKSAIKIVVGLLDALGPVLPPLAVLSALQVKSEGAVALVLGAMTWNVFAAFFHDEAAVLRSSPFIEAAVATGVGPWRLLLKHMLPHVLTRLAPLLAGMLAGYVGVFGALGFLGVAGDANHSMGFMIYDAKSFARQNPAYFVGALTGLLALIVAPYTLIGLFFGHRRNLNACYRKSFEKGC